MSLPFCHNSLDDKFHFATVRKSRSTDWNAELKGAALGYIKDSVLPESAKMLFALVEPILFGIPKKDNKFEKIHRLLENLDNTLKTVKDAIDYQNTFKKDDDYDQQLDELEAVYKRYEHDNHNVINQRKLDAKCNDVQTDSILVFYDKQLNTKNDRTLGKHDKFFTTYRGVNNFTGPPPRLRPHPSLRPRSSRSYSL